MNDKYKQLVDNYLSIRKSYRLDEKNGEKYKWELITKCAGKSLRFIFNLVEKYMLKNHLSSQ